MREIYPGKHHCIKLLKDYELTAHKKELGDTLCPFLANLLRLYDTLAMAFQSVFLFIL